jgi:hypothetical protein
LKRQQLEIPDWRNAMKRKVRLAISSSLCGPLSGVCLLASGLVLGSTLVTPVQARDYGYTDPYSRGGYYPSSRYYSRDIFYSARPPSRLSDEGVETPRVDYLKAQTAEKLRKAPVPPPTKGPLMVVVSIAQQKLTIYDEGVPLLHSKVSTGSRGHETPTGVFAVIQKARWHRSNLYSDAPMPFMQRITWSGVALHAGVLPGYPASHGCIRLPEDFAIRMWRTTQMGARVIVVQNDVSPVEIAHPVLFTHKQSITIVPPPVAQAAPLIGLRSTVEAKTDAVVAPAETAGQATAKTDTAQVKVADISAVSVLRGPQGAGQVSVANDQSSTEKTASQAEAATQVPPVSDTKTTTTADTNTAAISPPAPTQASALAGASSSREGPVARNAPVQTAPQPSQPSILAQAPVTQAPAVHATPEPDAQSPLAAPQPKLRPGPVSVFISRKERRLYVRKGFAPLFDMPIVIRDQDKAIGTHVFTALSLNADGETMRWNVVSVGAAAARADRRAEMEVRLASRKRDHGKEIMTDAVVAAPPSPVDAAKDALDRLEIPPEAVTRISELMSVGASLIVTDEGLGPETGQETDFVVLTHEHGAAEKPSKKR